MPDFPLTDAQVHDIAEAVMAELMPHVRSALEHAYAAGCRDGLKQADQMLDEAELP